MASVSYVLLIIIPMHGLYEIIAAEPHVGFRQCMVEAQDFNERKATKAFAVCMPTIKGVK